MSGDCAIHFYGLLHIQEGEALTTNAKVRSYREQIILYLKNAETLYKSLESHRIPFQLLTNDLEAIKSILPEIKKKLTVPIKQIKFTLKVPHNIRFYSAHFKIDVYRYFAALDPVCYVGLLDLDVVALNELPMALKHIIAQRIPGYYDISDQVLPSKGVAKVMQDLQRLMTHPTEGRWIGGEALMGPPDFFRSLTTKIDHIFEQYARCVNDIYHQGDETLVSAGLEELRREGVYMAELGSLGIVGRYWSVPCRHGQKAFRWYGNTFLLHLPSDKAFLAKVASDGVFSRQDFMKKYHVYLAKRIPLYILKLTKLSCEGKKYARYA